jgi:hypothetical protein
MSVNYVLDNGNFSQGGPVLENVLVAAGLRCGSVGVSSGGAVAASSLVTNNGGQLLLNAPAAFTAPQTAPANAVVSVKDGAIPQLVLRLNQTAPLLNGGNDVLTCYATSQATVANSVSVSRTEVSSLPEAQPAGSLAGVYGTGAFGGSPAHTQVAAADAIACPTVTANSAFRVWLAGGSTAAFAAGIVAGNVTAVVPGTGFTLNGTAGAIYGYEVLYA